MQLRATARYREIQEVLLEQITSGTWPPGFKLPSETELARQFECARMTVGKALAALANRGLLSRKRRAGTVVTTPRQLESVLEIHDIESEIVADGRAYRYERFRRLIRPATRADAAALNIAESTPVLSVAGVHHADGRPHALEERLINLKAVPAARSKSFTKTSPGRWLLASVPWSQAEHQIFAVTADRDAARRLRLAADKACLCIERTTWLDEQNVTYVRILYAADTHRLVAKFRPSRS